MTRHSRFATSSPKNESSLGPQSSILENLKVGFIGKKIWNIGKWGEVESGRIQLVA